jgi:apolipoprotein N-acyltransferase
LPGLRLASPRLNLPASLAAAAVSGLLLWAALPPADLGPLGFVALVPVLWAIRGARARRGALVGLVFGLAFYGPLLSWLIPLTILGWAVLVLGVAAFFAPLFAFTAAVWRDDAPVRGVIAFGAGWAGIEWVRGVWPFGGWAWVSLGDTQHGNPLLMPLVPVIGALGLGAVMAAINALVTVALTGVGEWRRVVAPAAVAVALAALPGVLPMPSAGGPLLDVAVVQGNVPFEVGVESRIIEDRVVAENHARLHRTLTGDPPDLAVWPENAIDRDPVRDPELGALVADAIREVGAFALVGAITEPTEGRLLNEDLLYSPDGGVVDRYAKIHLLPFGEYVPFRRYLDWIPDIRLVREDLSPGAEVGRFRIPPARFAGVICFENAFPGLVRETIAPDSGFLVVSTNNSTFGRTAAPEQHLMLSQMRAAENGRWVVHAALTGISGLISPRGEVIDRTGLFVPELLRGEIAAATGRTVYHRIGGWLPAVFLALALVAWLAPRRSRRRPVPPLPEGASVNVILPTFNERETIEEVVDGVLAVGDRVTVTVVDDSSPDGTGDVVRKLADRNPRLRLEERPGKGGLASAYLDGFARAIAEGSDLIVEMDADLSHRPQDLGRLLESARDHHVVIGSRYVPGGSVRNWSGLRRILSRGGNLYARLLLGFGVRDATTGYRVYRREALRELIDRPLRSEGYGFQIELVYRAWRRGLSVGEVPITFDERQHGQSKLSRTIVAEALWHVLVWAIRDRLLRRPAPPPESTPSPHKDDYVK